MEKIAPYAVNAQIKVAMKSPDGKKYDADLPRVINILKQAGYRGYVALEFEEAHPFEEIPKVMNVLRELVG